MSGKIYDGERYSASNCEIKRSSLTLGCLVSGGQTGADRAALDFAIRYGYCHGGWVPAGRLAEDGIIPLHYQLKELLDGSYRQRTKRNVQDADATLITNLAELDGGTLATVNFAKRLRKPYFVAQLDSGVTEDLVRAIRAWLDSEHVGILNVAGPRESKRPGVYTLTLELLVAVCSHSQRV